MTAFLPIVGRELRVTARRGATFWLRSGVVLAVLFAAAWVLLIQRDDSSAEVGKTLFYLLTGAAQLYCLAAGLRFTADCLSEEKREGTLGLLFLTDLKGYDVVIGKLVANSLNAFYGMLAVVPVMGLPLLMGGVTIGEFGRLTLVLVNTLFFSLAAGMLASAWMKTTRGAVGVALLSILFFTIGLPLLIQWVFWKVTPGYPDPSWCYLTSPIFSYVAGIDAMFTKLGHQPYYTTLGVIHLLGWGFLVLASLITPRSWQDAPRTGRIARASAAGRSWLEGGDVERIAFRARTLDQNAFYWLSTRPRLRPLWVIFVLGLFGAGWCWGAIKFTSDWFSEPVYVMTAMILNALLKCWIASESSRQIIEDRRIGAMELLLSTPITVRDIVRGQRLALMRQFFAPVVVVLCAEVLMMVFGASHQGYRNDRGWWLAVWIAAMIVAVTDAVALFWVSLWLGLTARNPKLALSGTVIRILVVPWILFAAFATFIGIASSGTGFGNGEAAAATMLVFWTLICLGVDLFFGLMARHGFMSQFRERAAQRFQQKPSLLKRLFST